MAKLPFQQMSFLPGTDVADFRTSSITPPPSLDGVMQSGSQLYKSRMDVAQGVMDVTQSIAKAIMVDRNEKEREQKIVKSNFKANLADELQEEGFKIFRQSQLDPTGDYEGQMLVTGNTILQRYKKQAEEEGFDDEFIRSLSPYSNSIIRNSRKGLFLDDTAYMENQRKKRRSLALEQALTDYKKTIINTELDLRENKDWDNAETKIAEIQEQLNTLVDDVVTPTNGFVGPNFSTETDIQNEKSRLANQLYDRLTEDGARWKISALDALDNEQAERETQIFREAENKMLEKIAADRVLEEVDQNEDYSKVRTDFLNVATEHIEKEAKKLYPKDDKKRQKFIDNSKLDFEKVYINENQQLNLSAVRRNLDSKKREEAKQEERAAKEDQLNLSDALNEHENKLNQLTAEFEGPDEKPAGDVLREVDQNINAIYKKYKKDEEGEDAAKNKLYNRQLKTSLEKTSLDEKRFVQIGEARKQVAEITKLEAGLKELRGREILQARIDAAKSYKQRAITIFEQQKKERMSADALDEALDELKKEIIVETFGDREGDPEYDHELAKIVKDELDDIFIASEHQIALQQADEAIDLEVFNAGRALINGRQADATGKPNIRGLKEIIETAEKKGLSVEATMSEVYTEFDKIDRQLQGELTTDAARHRYSLSSDYLEKRDVMIEGVRGRVQERESGKLKDAVETQLRDITNGIDRNEFQFAPRTFNDEKNLLTDPQEADWRMRNIAALLEKHTGPDKLYSIPEARERIRLAAKEIDLADAEMMVSENPKQALELLPIPKTGKKDLHFPGLEPTDRARLIERAKHNKKVIREFSKSEINVKVDDFLRWTMTGDKRAPSTLMPEVTDFKAPPDEVFFKMYIEKHVGNDPDDLFTPAEGLRIMGQMEYAQEFADASNGGNAKYGSGTRLEEKNLPELMQILKDFQPLNYLNNPPSGVRPNIDASFLETSFNNINGRVQSIIQKRQSDSAFYPSMEYMQRRLRESPDVDPSSYRFSEDRMNYLIKEQQEYGAGEIRLFTNDEVSQINDDWNEMNAVDKASFLFQMKQQSNNPELFGQMFHELAQGTSIKNSDQAYLENQDRTEIVKRIDRSSGYTEKIIAEALGQSGLEPSDLNEAMAADADLQNYMSAFTYHPDRGIGMYNMVRRYVVGGLTMKDADTGDLSNLIKGAVHDLFSRKNHVVSSSPFDEDIEGLTILLPKDKIPDIPSQRPGLYEEDARFEQITSEEIRLGLKLFVDEEVPSILTPDQHATFMSDENYFFQNSEDGQGLTLYHFASEDGQNPAKVGPPDGAIKLSFDRLFENILEVRKEFKVEFRPFGSISDIEKQQSRQRRRPGARTN